MSPQEKTNSSGKKITAAVLFADLVGSTRLYEAKGDVEARRLVGLYLQNLRQMITQNSGTSIKSLGDGILAYFSDADQAIQTAIDIHQSNTLFDGQSMLSHIGIHYGEIIIRKGDIFGDAVNLAARLTDIAKAEQTIIAQETLCQLSDKLKSQFRNIDKTRVKGKKQPISIYELITQDDDQTIMYSPDLLKQVSLEKVLKLSLENKHYTLDQESPSLSIGRDKDCDIVIISPMISRHHSKINYRKGKFYYTDQSTNGSYIRNTDDHEVFVRREQSQLPDKGVISVGVKVEKNTHESLIHFSIQ